jgi:hypothetical protein
VFDKSISSTARDFRQLTPLVVMSALSRPAPAGRRHRARDEGRCRSSTAHRRKAGTQDPAMVRLSHPGQCGRVAEQPRGEVLEEQVGDGRSPAGALSGHGSHDPSVPNPPSAPRTTGSWDDRHDGVDPPAWALQPIIETIRVGPQIRVPD